MSFSYKTENLVREQPFVAQLGCIIGQQRVCPPPFHVHSENTYVLLMTGPIPYEACLCLWWADTSLLDYRKAHCLAWKQEEADQTFVLYVLGQVGIPPWRSGG